jgi:hypothetical protein
MKTTKSTVKSAKQGTAVVTKTVLARYARRSGSNEYSYQVVLLRKSFTIELNSEALQIGIKDTYGKLITGYGCYNTCNMLLCKMLEEAARIRAVDLRLTRANVANFLWLQRFACARSALLIERRKFPSTRYYPASIILRSGKRVAVDGIAAEGVTGQVQHHELWCHAASRALPL